MKASNVLYKYVILIYGANSTQLRPAVVKTWIQEVLPPSSPTANNISK